MPSAASYTNKLRFNTEARNTKIQYPGGVSTTFRPNLPAMCTNFNTTITTTNNGIMSTIAGTGVRGYSGDNGPATNAQLNRPWGLAVDSIGNIYIADRINNRVRRVSVDGQITTIAGTGIAGYSGDTGPAINAQLDGPWNLAFDSSGNLYVSDLNNQRVRKINVNGIISTIAGTGVAGYNADGIQATTADLNTPWGLAVDSSGNVYVADSDNHRIRKVTVGGIISTIAGTGVAGYNADGIQATTAQLNTPSGVTLDSSGNVYIVDRSNHRVRKVAINGIISTIAGNGRAGYSGDGVIATDVRVNYPTSIALDSTGNVYIADSSNQRVRKVTLDGIISTIAGNGQAGYSGDGALATQARLNTPSGIALDFLGNLYFCEVFNDIARKVTYTTTVLPIYTPPWFTPLDYSVPCNCSASKFIACPACKIQTTIYDDSAPDGSLCIIDGNGVVVLDGNV